MDTFRIGATIILHGDGQTVTRLSNGHEVRAIWDIQPGQAETAGRYGIPLDTMNRTHDLAHAILAHALGLPESPTLAGVASGQHWAAWAAEEHACLALQAYAAAAGVDLGRVAARLSGS